MRLRTILVLAAMLAAFYLLPARTADFTSSPRWIGGVLLLAGLAALFVRQTKIQIHAPEDAAVRLESLFYMVALNVFLFAFIYFVLATAYPTEFADLTTRTDALYFTVSTIATVGFGDIHAVGQPARILVTVNMIFNVVFVGVFASVLTARAKQAFERRRNSQG